MKQYLLALDLGTSSLKASLVDIEGRIVRSHDEGYPVAHPRPGWAEQDPRDWWRALCICCRALLAGLDAGGVAGLSLTGQMMSCLPLGINGEVLHSAIIWADSRAEAELEVLRAALGDEGCYVITGMHPSANYGLPKMMWLKRHMPEVYGGTSVFLPPKDYLNFRLTGRLATDPENAAYLYCYDARAGGYSYSWLRDALCGPERDFHLIDALAAKAPPGAGGVLFLPYLLGERAPFWDAKLRASFVGITAQTGRDELCRSVLEGVGLHLGLILQRISACLPHGAISSMTLVGGGAGNPLWRQIIADVFGMPVHTVENPRQSTALGLAVMTGTALGLFPNVSVIRAFQPVVCATTPDPARTAYYRELSGIFADAAHALRDINHRLAGLQGQTF